MRHQTALREGTELIFWSHGPTAKSLRGVLRFTALNHRRMCLAPARKAKDPKT